MGIKAKMRYGGSGNWNGNGNGNGGGGGSSLISSVSASANTLAPGSSATASATLSDDSLSFLFGIPAGATGDTGPQGESGERGETGSQGPQGETGHRGTGILKVTTTPSPYGIPIGGFTPSYRMSLSTVTSESGVSEVYVGDIVEFQFYHTPVGYVDASYVYLGSFNSIRGPQGAAGATGATGETGDTGTAATISVGTVSTGAAGSSASVTNSGTSSAAVFDFSIPRGDTGEQGIQGESGPKGDTGATGERGGQTHKVTTAPSSYTTPVGGFTPTYRIALSTVKTQSGATDVIIGDMINYSYYMYGVGYVDASYVYLTARTSFRGSAGAAATISVGTVTTGSPGSDAVITNSGTTSAAVFNFTIPRGDTGPQGDTGERGIQGIQGPAGATGDTGPRGDTGPAGATGNGIASIVKTSTSGLVDTYTITYTNGTTTTYTVTNGRDGSGGSGETEYIITSDDVETLVPADPPYVYAGDTLSQTLVNLIGLISYVELEIPTDVGDMKKSVYDKNNNGEVDKAESVRNIGGNNYIEFSLDANGKGQYRAKGASTWIPFLSGPTKTELWRNDSPSSTFAAQDLQFSFNPSDYDALEIVWKGINTQSATPSNWETDATAQAITYDLRHYASRTSAVNQIFLPATSYTGSTYTYVRRVWFVENQWSPGEYHVHIGPTQRTNNANNNAAYNIPLLIYGVKY